MGDNLSVTGARYHQVAADIAAKIADGQYRVGEKIYARSIIAGQYSVSAETARKAIAVLAGVNIVESVHGSGVVIKSAENAVQYLKRFRNVQTFAELKTQTLLHIDRLSKENALLRESVEKLTDSADRFNSINPLNPYVAIVEENSECLGQSSAQLQFWQKTGCTVVALRRGEELTLSPDPYEKFQIGDVIYFIGSESAIDRVSSLTRKLL